MSTASSTKPNQSLSHRQETAALKPTVVYLLLLAGTCVMQCEPAAEPRRTFVISQGEYYAHPKPVQTLQDTELRFEAQFDNSAVYDLGDPALQTNKNKLLGFSECNTQHHKNSARFAWQWFNDRLEIYAYCYVNGDRVEAFIGTVALDTYNRYNIRLTSTQYIFQLNDESPVYVTHGDVCHTGLYYMLWPYFGGQISAPHDVRIDIKYPLIG